MLGLTDAVMVKPLSFKGEGMKITSQSLSFKKGSHEVLPTPRSSPKSSPKVVLGRSFSFKNWEPEEKSSDATDSLQMTDSDADTSACVMGKAEVDMAPLSPAIQMISPRPKSELDAAAVQVQKVYRSYRTRRNLADCAIVVEELWWKENLNVESMKIDELWWKTLDSAYLYLSSLSSFNDDKQETAVSRWSRAKKRLAKVGKGLSKDEKAQKLALQHWLEAIDPRHRYGHNLHIYYDIWFRSESTEPFFFWLDIGAGKEINLEKCPRTRLHDQLITYLGPNERAAYEVVVESGRLVYRKSGSSVNTVEGSKWIFVLSTCRVLYIGQKKKGKFQHSSFLAGAATTAAGRLVADDGVLKAIWPYSGHYLPTEDNFMEFISFLEENKVDLANVKRCSVDDDDNPSFRKSGDAAELGEAANTSEVADMNFELESNASAAAAAAPVLELAKRLSRKWSTGAGARIGCLRDYPADLQAKALEHVNLSPRVIPSPMGSSKVPIPSPRPSPNMRLSPGLSYMGVPSPRPSPNMRISPGTPYMGIPSPRVKLTLPKLPTPKKA